MNRLSMSRTLLFVLGMLFSILTRASAQMHSNLILCHTNTGFWGLADNATRAIVLEPKYDSLVLKSPYVVMLSGGKWGVALVDSVVRSLAPPQFDVPPHVLRFQGREYGEWLETEQNGKKRLLDKNLRLIHIPEYDEMYCFPTYSALSKNGLWGAVDTLGRIVLPMEFNTPIIFSRIYGEQQPHYAFTSRKGAIVAVDTNFRQVPLPYTLEDTSCAQYKTHQAGLGVENSFSQWHPTLYQPFDYTFTLVHRNCFFGALDANLKEIIPPRYTTLGWHDESLGPRGFIYAERGGKRGLLSRTDGFRELLFDVPDSVDFNNYEFDVPVFRVRHKGKWGVIDTLGREILAPRFDSLKISSNGLIFADSERFLVDSAGKAQTTLIDSIRQFFGGAKEPRFLVRKMGKYSVVNHRWQQVSPTEYEEMSILNTHFGIRDIRFVKVKQHGKWGIIDTSFTMLVRPQYNEIRENSFNDKTVSYIVQKDGKYGALDSTFRVCIPIIYTAISYVSEGLYQCRLGDTVVWWDAALRRECLPRGTEILDRNGKNTFDPNNRIVRQIYEWRGNDQTVFVRRGERFGVFSQGERRLLVPVECDSALLNYGAQALYSRQNGKWGVLCLRKHEIIITPAKYDFVEPSFTDGFARVRIGTRWGFLDSNVREVSIKYDSVMYNSRVEAYFVRSKDKWGVFMNGKERIVPVWDDIYRNQRFGRMYYFVRRGTNVGVLDSLFRPVLPPRYDDRDVFNSSSYDNASFIRVGKRYALINWRTMREIAPPIYDQTQGFRDGGTAQVRRGKLWGLLDTNGREIVPCGKYDGVFPFVNGLAAFLKNGRQGIIDKTLREIIPPRKGSIMKNGRYFSTYDNGLYGLLDTNSRELVPPIYKRIILLDSPKTHSFKAFVLRDSLWRPLDSAFRERAQPLYDDLSLLGKNWHSFLHARQGKKWGLLNAEGEEVLPLLYDSIALPSDTWYENASTIATIRQGSKYGVINFWGRIIVPVSFDTVVAMNRQKGMFKLRIDGKYGVMCNGKLVVGINYADVEEAGSYTSINNTYITEKGNSFGIFANEREVVPPRFEEVRGFDAETLLVREEGKWGIIDTAGTIRIAPKYAEIGRPVFVSTTFGYCAVARDSAGKCGVVNAKREIVPLDYDHIVLTATDVLSRNFVIVRRAGYYGFFRPSTMEQLTEPVYLPEDGIEDILYDLGNEETVRVRKGRRIVTLDTNGTEFYTKQP